MGLYDGLHVSDIHARQNSRNQKMQDRMSGGELGAPPFHITQPKTKMLQDIPNELFKAKWNLRIPELPRRCRPPTHMPAEESAHIARQCRSGKTFAVGQRDKEPHQ